MGCRFELFNTDAGEFQFDFYNGNNEKLMESAQFETQALAEQAIQDVRVGSMMSEMIAVGDGPENTKFFVIKNREGTVLVRSMLFENELIFNNSLHSVRDNACIAEIKA